MRFSRSYFYLLALALLALPHRARADGEASLAVVSAESTLTYHIVHKLHKVTAVSHAVSGKARLTPAATQVVLRAPVESFDSHNVNRDAHMKEAVEAARYPDVELKALAAALPLPTTFPASAVHTFKVQLIFHGVTQTFEVPVHLHFESANRIRARAEFAISLDAYKVERPSLMFVKVDDALQIQADLLFTR